jgi:hypothetical protein
VEPQRTDERAPSTPSAEPRMGVIAERMSRLWRGRSGGRRSSLESRDAAWEQPLETLAARVEHLEAELEGLQDAVYRQALLEHKNIGELRRRTQPEQIAHDLGEDARTRGL